MHIGEDLDDISGLDRQRKVNEYREKELNSLDTAVGGLEQISNTVFFKQFLIINFPM